MNCNVIYTHIHICRNIILNTISHIHYITTSYIHMFICRNIISYIHYITLSHTIAYIYTLWYILKHDVIHYVHMQDYHFKYNAYIICVTLSSTLSYTHVHEQEISFPIQCHIYIMIHFQVQWPICITFISRNIMLSTHIMSYTHYATFASTKSHTHYVHMINMNILFFKRGLDLMLLLC